MREKRGVLAEQELFLSHSFERIDYQLVNGCRAYCYDSNSIRTVAAPAGQKCGELATWRVFLENETGSGFGSWQARFLSANFGKILIPNTFQLQVQKRQNKFVMFMSNPLMVMSGFSLGF